MVQIIPAIIPKSFEELEEKLNLLKNKISSDLSLKESLKWVHIDIDESDEIFGANQTWANPSDLNKKDWPFLFEVHLMIKDPESILDVWLNSKIKRIITHIEVTANPEKIARRCHDEGVEYWLALNPDTSNDFIKPWLDKVDAILYLSVTPGFGGQEFQEPVLEKIKTLRADFPNVKIGIDGGVRVECARELKALGIQDITVGSALFGASDVKNAFVEFLKQIQQ